MSRCPLPTSVRRGILFLHKETQVPRQPPIPTAIDPGARRFWVQVDTGATPVSDTLTIHRDFSESLTISSNRSRVCFDSRGLTTTRRGCEAGDVRVEFTSGSHVQRVEATVLGKLLR